MKYGPNESHNNSISKLRNKKNVKCNNCGKKAHTYKTCLSNQKSRDGKASESSNAQSYLASTSDDNEILYSGTTIVAENKKQLTDV